MKNFILQLNFCFRVHDDKEDHEMTTLKNDVIQLKIKLKQMQDKD